MSFRAAAILAALLSATACSDYDFTDIADVEDGPEEITCAATAMVPFAPSATLPCEQEPIIGTFNPVVEWQWRDNPFEPDFKQIMASPSVANLTDDNGDGSIDDGDVPDVVFAAFQGGAYSSPGAIVALSGADGSTLWSVSSAGGHTPYSSSGVALANLDGSGMAVLVSASGGLMCLNADGSFRWHAAVSTDAYGHPSVADIDADGVAEIVFGNSVVNADGTVRWTNGAGSRADFSAFAMDLEGDGLMEIVTGNGVYEHDGTVRWNDADNGWPAVGDIDDDGLPDVVRVRGGRVSVTSGAGVPIWDAALTDGGGGPPTVADFDGDGQAEIGVASREVYRVIDGDGTVLWANTVQDYSSSVTGSSVFDFEGDGAAEVVYADEETLWVYDGATGTVELAWTNHSSGTLYEYPLVVDIDNDGSAEIVLASNDYSSYNDSRGITVIGDLDSSWAAARPIWNQHTYSVNNINNDGTVPTSPTPNWMDRNSFRAGNSETRVGLQQADLRIGAPDHCLDTCSRDAFTAYIPVGNSGIAESGEVDIALYAVDGATVQLVTTLAVTGLVPGTSSVAAVEIERADFGTHGLVAIVDDNGSGIGSEIECEEGNNKWVWNSFPCD